MGMDKGLTPSNDDHEGAGAVRTGASEPELRLVTVMLCSLCIDGMGGECHTPGCALYMNDSPDSPLVIVANLKVEMFDA